MPARDVEGLPLYPHAPPGKSRLDHRPTIEASIRYWEAVRARAKRAHNAPLERTAAGLRRSYEALWIEAARAERP
jgi:hypothetical protein